MGYVARFTEPSPTDKNWIHVSKGGKNSCILIKGNSVLPNCVGYAWGRFMEILGTTPKLSRNNAEDWYGHSDGYERGKTPKLGAVICWSKGKTANGNDGAGHVAIVEAIEPNGDITISQSGYNARKFWTSKVTKASGYALSGYTFQGFIYNPAVTVSKPSSNLNKVVDEIIAGKWGNGKDRIINLTNAGYDYNVLQKMVNDKLNGKPTAHLKSNEEIAKEVIRGEWGNGKTRVKRLTSAGYNANAIQLIVNRMLS